MLIERHPDLNRVVWLNSLPKQSVGAEIGVRRGGFSRRILATMRPQRLWLVDCWATQPDVPYNVTDESCLLHMCTALERVRDGIVAGVVRILCGFSREVARYVPDGSLDWVYVDAGHTYMECHEDLCLWSPKVKLGGIVAGHDYVEVEHVGVIGAVQDFMLEKNQKALNLTGEDVPTFWYVKT